jgi:hypothetical protein
MIWCIAAAGRAWDLCLYPVCLQPDLMEQIRACRSFPGPDMSISSNASLKNEDRVQARQLMGQ